MDPNESVRLELFLYEREWFAQQVGTRFDSKQHIIALCLNRDHVAQSNQQNPSVHFYGNSGKLSLCKRLWRWQIFHQSRGFFPGY